jgi:hypothetical protein
MSLSSHTAYGEGKEKKGDQKQLWSMTELEAEPRRPEKGEGRQ